MDKLLQDLRYGARGFLRQPGFTLTAVLALALGIGANTAVFSVVYAVLIKPMPYPQPEALVYAHDTYPAVPSASVSFAKLEALRAGTRSLSGLGGLAPIGLTLTGAAQPEQISATQVSADLLKVVGVQPLHGRLFTAEEDLPTGPKAVILSYQLWQRRFGADPKVLGTTIAVDGISRQIVGIMPQGQGYPSLTDAWVPLELAPGQPPAGNFLRLLGRMRDGATVEQVQQDLAAVNREFNTKHGQLRDVLVTSLYEAQVSRDRRMLLILQGVVAFVLLVACANVANLLLARSVSRQRELAIRSAIGAGRARIFRQVLTESLMLSAIGGVAGVLLASWLMRLFLSLSPVLPRVQTISIDSRILLFTLAIAMITGVLFGLAPARQGFHADPNDSLRDSGTRSATGGSKGASRTLVTAEVALALVLVTGAGLLVKSLIRLQGESIGFETEGIFTFNLNLPAARYAPPTRADFYRRFLDDVRAVPGVQAAAAINYVPTTNFGFNGGFSIAGRPPFDAAKAPVAEFRFVTPGYFATMGVPILRGADFSSAQTAASAQVAIINDTMARQFFAGRDPIGEALLLGSGPNVAPRQIVGVVGDVRDGGLSIAPVPEIYLPHAQTGTAAMGIVVRLAGDMRMDAVLPTVRQRLAAADPNLPMIKPQMLRTAVEATAGNTRMVSILTSVFALVAAALASVGVYSLMAYSVAQRTREIGIRVALGANRRAIVRMILVEGLGLAAVGVAIGLVAAYFLTQTLQTLLYEVRPADPVVLITTCAGVFLVALLASVIPAIRALRVGPMVALRSE